MPVRCGPGKPVLLTFDGDHLSVQPLLRVGAPIYLAVADLNASKAGEAPFVPYTIIVHHFLSSK